MDSVTGADNAGKNYTSVASTDTTAEYYETYRSFLEYFAKNVDPTDQLPVRVPNYTLDENEINGAVIDWMIQYLTDKKCPQTLVAPIIKLALDQTHRTLRKAPEQYGYMPNANEYQPLKLMQLSISKTNDVCQSLLDNLHLDKLMPSPPAQSTRPPLYSAKGFKNTRRHMEDRHIIIDDFNSIFDIKDSDRTSYYAVFDGHGGTDAAAYSVSHLHCEIAASKHYPQRPAQALREAFLNTDVKFIEKSKKLVGDVFLLAKKLVAGTTAVCALYRPIERSLIVGWVGDSKALLVSQNRLLQIVNPHKPDSESERQRIEDSGGCVIELSGCVRVNGRLAVSRAIGDYGLKDVVIGDPDIVCIPLNGNEDFLVMACDGLWDYLEEDEVAIMVYDMLEKNKGDVQPIAAQLIEFAKKSSSTDNISIIAVFFKDPKQIVAEYNLRKSQQLTITMDFESTNGRHHLEDGLLASEASVNAVVGDDVPAPPDHHLHAHLNAIDEYKMHVDFKPLANEPLQSHHNDFHFGNNGDDEFHSNVIETTATINTTLTSSMKSSSNGDVDKLSSNELDIDDHEDNDDDDDDDEREIDNEHDDFGPETDVDATDDAAISPLSPTLETNEIMLNNELNVDAKINYDNGLGGYDFIERAIDNVIAPAVDIDNQLDFTEEIVKKENEQDDDMQPQFEDNRFMDNATDHKVTTAAAVHAEYENDIDDNEPELRNKIDFSEKKEYSFEREDYEKELDPFGDVPAELIAISKEAAVAAANDEKDKDYDVDDEDDEDDDGDYEDNGSNFAENLKGAQIGEILTTEQHVLPTNNQVPAEKVVVAESGDDSDDEWNYIKVAKDKAEQERESAANDEKENTKPDESSIASPTPPTASIGEPDIVSHLIEESHAVAQAFVEPEEACSELLEEKQESEQQHSFELEQVEQSSLVVNDSDLGSDHELDVEDMDSQLNPDAKEFIPVSPQRTAPMSPPFSNGTGGGMLGTRPDLLDDDVVSQSPRKGSSCLMDDIVLPSEDDFSEISKRPSELVVSDEAITFDAAAAAAAATNVNNELLKEAHRPGSSSSQCSYQEMNLKEAMHGDEKQEFAAEDADSHAITGDIPTENEPIPSNGGDEHIDVFAKSLREQDPMHMSFYNDGTEPSAFENNPFNVAEVDMNTVQPLPDDVDDEIVQNDATEQNGFVEFTPNTVDEPENTPASPSRISDLEFVPQEQYIDTETDAHKELISPSEQHETKTIDAVEEQQLPITQAAREIVTEVTSILNEFEVHHHQQATNNFTDAAAEQNVSAENRNEFLEDVINKSGLSVNASEFEFLPSQLFVGSVDEIASQPDEVESKAAEIVSGTHVLESDFAISQVTETVELITPEPQHEELQHEIIGDGQQSIETVAISDLQEIAPEPNFDEKNIETIATAGIAAVTAVGAVAATALAAKSPIKSTSTKIVDAKKPEIKSRTSATTTATKKTTAIASKTGLKSTVPSNTRTVSASPTKSTAPKVTAAAPKPASRTVPPKAPIEKKTTTTTTTATRKPLSNGVASTITKKTTTTTSSLTNTKSATGTARPLPSAATKSVTARTTSTTLTSSKPTSTLSKPASTAAPRVPLSARTVTKPLASTTTAAKPKTTLSSTSATTKLKSALVPSTVRSALLNKPKTTSTVDKPLLSTRTATLKPTSPGKTLSSTTTLKKIDSTKSPSSKPVGATTKMSTLGVASSTVAAKRLTPTRKPLTTTAGTRITPIKSPKVPAATNGVAAATKKSTAVTKRTSAANETITLNGVATDTKIIEQFNGLNLDNGGDDIVTTISSTTTTTFTTNTELIAEPMLFANGGGAGDGKAIIDLAAD